VEPRGHPRSASDFRHTVAMKLDHPGFRDLIVDALARLARQKA